MKSTLSYLLVLFLFIVTISCDKEDESKIYSDIEGVWYNQRDNSETDETSTFEWSFRNDGTLEIIYSHLKNNSNFLGYSVLHKGNYNVNDGILYMENMMTYSYNFNGVNYVDGSSYYQDKVSFYSNTPSGPWFNSAAVSFQKRKKELKLTYLECNDTSNCVGFETLKRK